MTAAIAPDLRAAIAAFATHDRVLIAIDFDGTLAPEVDVPDEARALPAAVDALRVLHRMPQTTIAFVSGRSLASLDVVVPPDLDVAMIGSHGLELRIAPGDEVPAVDARDRARVEALLAAVHPLVAAVDGAWIEQKPAGFAVHTRLVEVTAADELQRLVRSVATGFNRDLTVREGKNVVELSVRDATKGDGLRLLRERVNPEAVLFAGDDVTDEDALAALEPGDLGIKVGAAATIAPFRVADPAAMASVLADLAVARLAR